MSNVREAYDNWSTKYDSDRNLTRDLDSLITKQTFVNPQFNSIVEIGCGTGKNTLFRLTNCLIILKERIKPNLNPLCLCDFARDSNSKY